MANYETADLGGHIERGPFMVQTKNTAPLFHALAELWDVERNYAGRPVEWIAERAEEFAWSAQRLVAESVTNHRYTAVHASHDVGKSFIASRLMGWWIDTHPIGEAFVVSTAPTAAQVSAILWRELAKLKGKMDTMAKASPGYASLPGKINRAGYPQWYQGAELIGYGRKPSDYDEGSFQGIHARYPFIVIDEACFVAKHLYDAIDALATNENARVLAIGNPDDPGSYFASICKPGSGWNVIHLDGLRSPNLTKAMVIGYKSQGWGYENPKYPALWALMRAENIPFSEEKVPDGIRDLLVSPQWIEERIYRWGGITEEQARVLPPAELEALVVRRCSANPLFTSKVRGEFPTEGNDGVIPLAWVQRAVNRWHDLFDPKGAGSNLPVSMLAVEPGRKVLGVDVARSGEDETAVATRYGNIVEKIERMRIADTMETVDFVARGMMEPGSFAIVDVIGIGAGVYDRLMQMKTNGEIVGTPYPFNASAKSPENTDAIGEFHFRNDRSGAWWKMRELLDPSKGSNIALPDDERLIEELIAPHYTHYVGGIIAIESKDEIRKRIGRSTDSADAVIQAFWIEGRPADNTAIAWGANMPNSPVVRYDGYKPFTDEDFSTGAGFNSGSDWQMNGSALGGIEESGPW